MLTVNRVPQGMETAYVLSGTIDENDNLFQLFGNPPAKIRLLTRQVTRINSVGLRNWMALFRTFSEAGIQMVYEECSVALTNHLGMILKAGGGGKVESVMAPFICKPCNQTFQVATKLQGVHEIKPFISGQRCPKCGALAAFDDVPAQYFSYLNI